MYFICIILFKILQQQIYIKLPYQKDFYYTLQMNNGYDVLLHLLYLINLFIHYQKITRFMQKQSPRYQPSSSNYSSQMINSYISNQITVDQCKSQIMNKLQRIKIILDTIQNDIKINHTNSNQLQTNIVHFVKKFKNDLKLLLGEFEVIRAVVSKIEKENYQKHDLSKQILIKTIRQQLKRFQSIIPQHVQEQVQKSRLKSNQVSNSIRCINESTQDKTNSKPVQQELIPMLNLQMKQKTVSEVQAILQNRQLLMDLNQFLLRQSKETHAKDQNLQCQLKQLQEQQSDTQHLHLESIPYHEQQQNLRSSKISSATQRLQQQEQRKVYRQFMERQKIRQDKTPVKIAKRIALGLIIAAIICTIIACIIVYKVVGVLSREY